MKNVTRRELLKAGGILGLGLAVNRLSSLTDAHAAIQEPQKWDSSADVVIVGGGMAGLTAAISAREAGASVLLLEKAAELGGSAILSGGLLSIGPTSEQKAQGIVDTADKIYADLMKNNEIDPQMLEPEMIRAYADNGGRIYEWLKSMGVIKLLLPEVGTLGGYDSVRRMLTLDMVKTIAALKETAVKKGALILSSTTAERLTLGKNGEITGVSARRKDSIAYYKANKGVILASGCFTGSPEMLYRWGGPALANAMTLGAPTNTGDGMNMALSVGAAARLIYIPAIVEAMGPDDTRISMPQILWDGAIVVNKNAKRFVNECISCTLIGAETAKQPEGCGYIIYDKMIPKAPSNFRLRNHIKQKGHVYTAQSLEELEKMLGIPGLAATVKEYNSYVANGGDPIGRNCLQGDMGKPVKIENPPFYAIKASGGMYFSSAGIKTNPQAQVLNWNGEVIPRLYVAGQTRGRFAVPYHLGHAMVFGYFAGQNAAREKLLS